MTLTSDGDDEISGRSNLGIDLNDSPLQNLENKENEKPWYDGIARKPVSFRAKKRIDSV